MNESKRVIDARGLACPEPVIRTKKALEEGGFDVVYVLVDNAAARENVTRYASYSGHGIISVLEDSGVYTIEIEACAKGRANAHPPSDEAGASLPESPGEEADRGRSSAGATILIASDKMGKGSDELGSLLLKGFIYALAEGEVPPRRIIFMNSGVKASTEGSAAMGDLQRLAARGVEILSCGTCLDYFGLKEKLKVGRISNMYEISGYLLEGRTLSI